MAILFLTGVALAAEYKEYVDRGPNYYNILGVDRTASQSEIKKAFRTTSKVMHPDKNPSPDAHAKFTELNEIYEVLSDENSRRVYERYGPLHGANKNAKHGENDWLVGMVFFYTIWCLLTFVLTTGKSNSQGRTWCWVALCLSAFMEFAMQVGQADPGASIFPRLTIREKIDMIHSLYPSIMNGCRLLSQYIFVDTEMILHKRLHDIYEAQKELLEVVGTLQASLDKTRGGKSAALNVSGSESGASAVAKPGEKVSVGKGEEGLTANERLHRRKVEMEKAQAAQAAEAKKKGSMGIPSWVWMVGIYLFFNYIGK